MADHARKLKVHLTIEQRAELERLSRSGKSSVRHARRARILLLADEDHPEGRRTDWQIAELVELTEKQVKRIRHQFVREGLERAVSRKPRSDAGIPKVFDGTAEAQLVALCCSEPPKGRQRWTLKLLVDELCRLQVVASVCPETVRRCLKKIASSPGRQNVFVFPKKTAHGSSRTWSKSSTSTARRSTKRTR